VAFGCALFPIFCAAHYVVQKHHSEPARKSVLNISREHHSFMQALRSLNDSDMRRTFFFTSAPITFSPDVAQSAAQIALRRTDVETFLVTSPAADNEPVSNSGATQGDIVVLRFDNGRLIDQTASFEADPDAFLGCLDSGQYALRVSKNDVTAGRDAYSVLVRDVHNQSMTILYSLNEGQLKIFKANLDLNGQATFDVESSTPKGVYRFLAFKLTGSSEWIRSKATITVH
jgi:hypothetical protein